MVESVIVLCLVMFPVGIYSNDEANVNAVISTFFIIEKEVKAKKGPMEVKTNKKLKVILYGEQLQRIHSISFTSQQPSSQFGECKPSVDKFTVELGQEATLVSFISLPSLPSTDSVYYMCALIEGATSKEPQWWYQALHQRIRTKPTQYYLGNVWLDAIACFVFLFMSAWLSCLYLGLIPLTVEDLRILEAGGSEKEKRYAKLLIPIRMDVNYLLCSLIFTNVLFNVLFALFLENLVKDKNISLISGAFILTIFGEIVPQAIGCQYGLQVGAKTIALPKILMSISFPLSFPVSYVLNRIVGKDVSQGYTRENLRQLVAEQTKTGNLDMDEMNIIHGALSLPTKTANEIMTPLHVSFMVRSDAILDHQTLFEIFTCGYTRIPVYDEVPSNICGILFTKDLLLVDPEVRSPVSTMYRYHKRPLLLVHEKESLMKMLKLFLSKKTHMAFVEHVEIEGDDVLRDIIGLVTLEDVIEEILQTEIEDEVVKLDNLKKGRALSSIPIIFPKAPAHQTYSSMPPQIKEVVFNFLHTKVPGFNDPQLNLDQLELFLGGNVLVERRMSKHRNENLLLQRGKYVDYAILIVYGRVQVEPNTIEKLYFQAGPFVMFGLPFLQDISASLTKLPLSQWTDMSVHSSLTYRPDYSVFLLSDVTYLPLSIRQYIRLRLMATNIRSPHTGEASTKRNSNVTDQSKNFYLMQRSVSGVSGVTPHKSPKL